MQEEQEEQNGGGVGNDRSYSHFWWAGASATQLGWAVVSYRRGCNQSTLMPFKAFAVASLYVGAAASASVAALRASGVHKVEDLIELGANIRTGLGIQRRARDE